MLNRVLDVLAREGWFDTSVPFEKAINLTQGACLWLMLTRGGECDTYVKFSDCTNLGPEAQRYAAASRCYPKLVPQFLGHVHKDDIDVLVCRAVDYRALNPGRLQRSSARDRVLQKLQPYFSAMPSTRLPHDLTPVLNAELVENLRKYFESHALHLLAQRWLSSDAARRSTGLPNMPQHCDFVLNNLGQTRDGAAVVFDWEDFGAACLPGLDLFTLELSMAGDASRLIHGREHRVDPTQSFVRNACESIQLEFGDYLDLTPMYALAFRYLKRNYGPDVRERIDRLLLDLDQQQATAAARVT